MLAVFDDESGFGHQAGPRHRAQGGTSILTGAANERSLRPYALDPAFEEIDLRRRPGASAGWSRSGNARIASACRLTSRTPSSTRSRPAISPATTSSTTSRRIGHRNRRVGGTVVLGEWTTPSAISRPSAAAGHDSGWLLPVPRRNLPGATQLGRAVVPDPQLLQQSGPGRPLRRLGRAADLLRGDARHVRPVAIAHTRDGTATAPSSRSLEGRR